MTPRPDPAEPAATPARIDVRDTPEGASLRVRVAPRSKRDAIVGAREGALVVRLTAPPVEGAANASLSRILARAFAVAPSAVRLVHGSAGRDKLVRVSGRSAAEIRAALGGIV